jgi:hypothetical protein
VVPASVGDMKPSSRTRRRDAERIWGISEGDYQRFRVFLAFGFFLLGLELGIDFRLKELQNHELALPENLEVVESVDEQEHCLSDVQLQMKDVLNLKRYSF